MRECIVNSTNNEEEWLQRKWRPAVAITYIVICSFDFIIFPISWAVFLHITGNTVNAWDPITLKGAGLFHASFGAILGVAAYTRGQEKITRNELYNRHDEYRDSRQPEVINRSEPRRRRSSSRYEPPT